jgi:hypothetical protein
VKLGRGVNASIKVTIVKKEIVANRIGAGLAREA